MDHVLFAVGLERMRWHAYAIANVFLDHFQLDFLRSISELRAGATVSSRESQENMFREHTRKLAEEILNARIRALGLIQENVLFRGTPTSVLAVSQELSRMFQTEQLSQMVEFKLSELDRLQVDLSEYLRLKDLKSTAEWWKTVWK